MFGEMAVLEGKPRSADAVCEGDTVLQALDREALERLAHDMPSLYGQLLLGISLHLASRLRATTLELNAAVE
jgi:CRP-like cAMP-binding protein